MNKPDFELNRFELGARVAIALNIDNGVGYLWALLADANPNSSFADGYYGD